MDVEAIRKVIRAIEAASPSRIRMHTFYSWDNQTCNTAACIAGWATWTLCLEHPAWDNHYVRQYKGHSDIPIRILMEDVEERTQQAFGIDESRGRRLFYMEYAGYSCAIALRKFGVTRIGSYELSESEPLSYFDHMPPLFRKYAAIKVLELLIEHNEVLWDKAFELAAQELGWDIVCQGYIREKNIDDEPADL